MILFPDGPRGNGNERPQTFQGTGSSEHQRRYKPRTGRLIVLAYLSDRSIKQKNIFYFIKFDTADRNLELAV